MPDYSKSKIYTIRCYTNPDHIYVGSTLNPLSKRFAEHKKRSKTKPDVLLYLTIGTDWDQYYIELYETFACNSREELKQREGEVTRQISTLNNLVMGKSKQDWINDIREHKEQEKRWRENR